MPVKKGKKQIKSVIALRTLCRQADVPHMKVYDYMKEKYDSLTHDEKSRLANTFFDQTQSFLNKIGFYLTIARIKDPEKK